MTEPLVVPTEQLLDVHFHYRLNWATRQARQKLRTADELGEHMHYRIAEAVDYIDYLQRVINAYYVRLGKISRQKRK